MAIGFLTPLFLAGLALLAVPVVIHLRRRHRSRVQVFPSLMFLRQVQQTSLRRRRIRHWSLLALRSLALLALVLAFARPLLRDDAAAADRGARGRELIVLIDNSWSMGFEDRFARAVNAAAERIAALGADDVVSLIAFSDRARVEAEPTAELDRVEQIVRELGVEPRGTRYGPALKLARKMVLESRLPQRRVVLLTDFQRIGWERGEDLRLPPGTELEWVDLSAGAGGNAVANLAVAGVVIERSLDGDRERLAVQARVTRRGGEGESAASVALEIAGREVGRRDLRLEPEASTVVGFEPFSLPQGISRGRILVSGDTLTADNQYFFVLSRAQALAVLLVEERRSSGPASGFYLEQALALGQDPIIEVRRRAPSGLGDEELSRAGVVMLSDVGIDAGGANRLRSFVERGGGLLVALGSRSEGTHGALAAAGLIAGPVGAATAGESPARIARIAAVDRAASDLEPFAGPRSGDFGTARFFRHRPVRTEEGDRVLARFDDGEVALVERSVGEGRVLLWTSTLDTYWNDFALQPVFLPFLHQITKGLAGFRPPASSHTVGDKVDLLALQEFAGAATDEKLAATAPGGQALAVGEVLDLEQQGFYVLTRGDREVGVLAANVEARESDLTVVDAEELASALRPAADASAVDAAAAAEQTPGEREAAQGWWRYLVLAVLLLLVAEVFVANRLSAAGS